MAAIQKIRSKGKLLLVIIGLGLFAFIAEPLVDACKSLFGSDVNLAGKIYSEKIDVQEYQQMLSECELAKFGSRNPSEQEREQANDEVWQELVSYTIVKHECDKLGLTVTDGEMQRVLNEGTNPLLRQTPFVNQQTGRFDVNMLKSILDEYENMKRNSQQVTPDQLEQYQQVVTYWNYTEKQLRRQLLMQKYQMLLAKCVLSNKVEAKRNFEASSTSNTLLVASVPYASINDNDITVSDADLKAKYNEQKELYYNEMETRDIKYISIPVKASTADHKALEEELTATAKQMAETEDVANIVRASNSSVNYSTMPVTKAYLPNDIQNMIDSVAVGAVKGPFYTASDNTLNVVKLLGTTQAADSVQFCQFVVPGTSRDDVAARADSIDALIKSGQSLDSIAKSLGQAKLEESWLTSEQYQGATLDDDNLKYIKTIASTAEIGKVEKLEFAQGGRMFLKVLKRANVVKKYDVAVVKRTVDFSAETYNKAYNEFSKFVANNTTLTDIEANAAKSGYSVQTRMNLTNTEHRVANVSSTREAMKWVFDAEEGDVSPLYECGNNDNLLLVVLTKIHPKGYRSLAEVQDELRIAVLNDKKAEQLKGSLAGVKSVAEAQGKGIAALAVDTVSAVSANGMAMIPTVQTPEPILNATIAGKKTNDFVGPIKGFNGVYVYQVLDQTKDETAYDEKAQKEQALQRSLRNMGSFFNSLVRKANIVDRRYMFF